jgi:hypothetical protein
MSSDMYKWISASLLCTTIITGMASIYLFNQVNTLQIENQRTLSALDKFTIKVNIKVDYGNGTIIWYNNTRVSVGESLLNATETTAALVVSQSIMGSFVTSINGVGDDPNAWWLWWYNDGEWIQGPVGADQWMLHDGDEVAWVYTSF